MFLSLFTQNAFGKAFLPEIYYLGGIPLTEEVGRDTRRMIGKLAQDDAPFFLVSFMATTHPPFTSKYPYYSLYSDPEYRGESKFIMAKLRDPWEIIRAQAEPKSKFDLEQVIDLYDGCVRNFDDEVGRILAYLDACQARRQHDRRRLQRPRFRVLRARDLGPGQLGHRRLLGPRSDHHCRSEDPGTAKGDAGGAHGRYRADTAGARRIAILAVRTGRVVGTPDARRGAGHRTARVQRDRCLAHRSPRNAGEALALSALARAAGGSGQAHRHDLAQAQVRRHHHCRQGSHGARRRLEAHLPAADRRRHLPAVQHSRGSGMPAQRRWINIPRSSAQLKSLLDAWMDDDPKSGRRGPSGVVACPTRRPASKTPSQDFLRT